MSGGVPGRLSRRPCRRGRCEVLNLRLDGTQALLVPSLPIGVWMRAVCRLAWIESGQAMSAAPAIAITDPTREELLDLIHRHRTRAAAARSLGMSRNVFGRLLARRGLLSEFPATRGPKVKPVEIHVPPTATAEMLPVIQALARGQQIPLRPDSALQREMLRQGVLRTVRRSWGVAVELAD